MVVPNCSSADYNYISTEFMHLRYSGLSHHLPSLTHIHIHKGSFQIAFPMASSRIFSSRSISRLAATSCKRQVCRLHITGASATPSPLLSSETTTGTYPPRTTDLKTECRNRNLKVHGSKAEVRECLEPERMLRLCQC